MTLLELSRKHDELADMYERVTEDPPVDHRATAAALRELLEYRECEVFGYDRNSVNELADKTNRLLCGDLE